MKASSDVSTFQTYYHEKGESIIMKSDMSTTSIK